MKKSLLTAILFFLFSLPVSAHEVRVRYTIKTPVGINSGHQTTSRPQPTDVPGANGVKKTTTQNMPLQPVSRGGNSSTGKLSEKDTGRKIARINPAKKGIVTTGIEPFNKFLTEQGAKTREIVLAHLSQYYTGEELVSMDNLIKAESGYQYDVLNSIGAGGLPQALPYSKMGCPLTEEGVICQVEWMKSYVERRYGSPSKAWNFWLSEVPINGEDVGHWY